MRCAWLVLIGLSLVGAGCGQRNPFAAYTPDRLAGEYRADIGFESSEKAKADPAEAFGRALAQGIVQALRLELKKDGTFVLSMILPVSGTYRVEGDRIVLKPDRASDKGQSGDKGEFNVSFGGDKNELVLQIQDGGKTLRAIGEAKDAKDADLLFRRE